MLNILSIHAYDGQFRDIQLIQFIIQQKVAKNGQQLKLIFLNKTVPDIL